MAKVEIKINGRAYAAEAPATWNDLPMPTLLHFVSIVYAPELGEDGFRRSLTSLQLLMLAQHLLGIEQEDLEAWRNDCIMASLRDQDISPVPALRDGDDIFFEELRAVAHTLLGGLFHIEEDEETGATLYSIRLNLTRNPYPEIVNAPPQGRYKSSRLHAQHTKRYPCAADGLANITIYEMAATFARFEAFLATNDPKHALELLGILYRPPKPDTRENRESAYEGDIRQPYRLREGTVPARAKLFSTVPVLTIRVILLWFSSCRSEIVRAWPKVFSASPGDDGGRLGYGWGGILLSVAGGPSGLAAVADQHHSNTLTWLSMKSDEAEEMERRIREAGKK